MNTARRENHKPPPTKTVFILGGGAAFGAHQAGALEQLTLSGIRPDAIIGSSVGIVNALSYVSGGCDLMIENWTEVNSAQVLIGPSLIHNPFLGNSLMSMDRMVGWLEGKVDFKRAFESPIELSFVLLNLSNGRTYLRGNRTEKNADDFRTVSRIGYRIPILYPPIKFEGHYWCDGGLAWNIPLEHAIEMGANEIYILSVIRQDLPQWRVFPSVAHVSYRLLEVMWAHQGNSSRVRALVNRGSYHGARIIDIEPREYLGADPASILWTSPSKARRLIEMGREDAALALEAGRGGE
ncbi:MAG: patatin-like phospholipase family protein, partial [Candidatus Binataceae bacterium]